MNDRPTVTIREATLRAMLWSALGSEPHDDWCHSRPEVCGDCRCSCTRDSRVSTRVMGFLVEGANDTGGIELSDHHLATHRALFIERRAAVLAGAEAYDAPGNNRAYWRRAAKNQLIEEGRLP